MFKANKEKLCFLEKNSPKFIQSTDRYGRKPNTIVIHSTGSGRSPDLIAKSLTTKTVSGSWHTILNEEQLIRLIPYQKASCSNKLLGNLRTINIGICLNDKDWLRLIKTGKDTQLVFHIAYIAAQANQEVKKIFGVNIPAVRITREEYIKGLPGFIPHCDLDGHKCFDNCFPWNDFLNIYDRICHPQKLTPAILVAEAAAVSLSPGAIASTILKSYENYETVGEIICQTLPKGMILENVFQRYAERLPNDEEKRKLKELSDKHSLQYVLELIAEQINNSKTLPSQNDLKLFQIQSTSANTTIGSGGRGNALDT